MPTLRLTKNLLAGLMFVGFGVFGLWLGGDLDAGSASDMGPGYFPRAVCVVLVALGAMLSASDLLREGDAAERWSWKPLILITASSLAFALLLKPLGLVASLAITTVCASAAGPMLRPLSLALLATVLIGLNVGIFVIGLKMPIQLWPSAF